MAVAQRRAGKFFMQCRESGELASSKVAPRRRAGKKKTRASANTSGAKFTAAMTARECVDLLSTPNEEHVRRRTVLLPDRRSGASSSENGALAG
jgi:hypothetical protein